MPWDSELCATFYVGHPSVPGPGARLLEQLELIGVTRVQVAREVSEQVTGRWCGMDVEVRDRALDVFRAVTLVFPEPAVRAAGWPGGCSTFWPAVTAAFSVGCERLRPAVAFVTDLAGPDVDQIVADREQWLVRANPVPLLHDGFALLHLNHTWFPDLAGVLRGLSYRRVRLAGGPLLIGVETGGEPGPRP